MAQANQACQDLARQDQGLQGSVISYWQAMMQPAGILERKRVSYTPWVFTVKGPKILHLSA
jgi:hypothetical protein